MNHQRYLYPLEARASGKWIRRASAVRGWSIGRRLARFRRAS